jgi:hypothetical protein
MAYQIKGDLEVKRGLGLGSLTTAQRLAYTPASAGYTVFDSTVGDEYSWDGAVWNIKSGLEARGSVTTDADVGAGIYNLDTAGGAFDFTLPAATGSQERRILVGDNLVNNLTVKVQVGEALNFTTNGTQLINKNGSVWYAIDRATGVWDLYQANTSPVENVPAMSSTGNIAAVTFGGNANIFLALAHSGGSIKVPTDAVAGNTLTFIISATAHNYATFDAAFVLANGQTGPTVVMNTGNTVTISFTSTDGTTWNCITAPIKYSAMNAATAALISFTQQDEIDVYLANVTLTTNDGASWGVVSDVGYVVRMEGSYMGSSAVNTDLTPDFSSGNASEIRITTTAGPFNIATPSGNPVLGDIIPVSVTMSNAHNVAVDFVFSSAYVTETGIAIGTITLEATGANAPHKTVWFTPDFKADGTVVYRSQSDFANTADAARTSETITQTAHGFVVTQPIYHDGTDWKASIADPSGATVTQAVVTLVTDANTFEATTHGVATVTAHGLTAGEYYWLDQATSAVTLTQPTSGIAQGILHVRDVNTLFIDVEQAVSAAEATTSVALGYGRRARQSLLSVSFTGGGSTEFVWDSNSYVFGMTVSGNGFSVASAGRYRVALTAYLSNVATDGNMKVVVNGLAIFADYINMEVGTNTFSFEYAGLNLSAGDVVTLAWSPNSIDTISILEGTTFTMEQLPSSTVIPSTALVVNDQATSGYFDMGTTRMQWGIDTSAVAGNRTVTLPVAFANATYTVTTSVARIAGTGMATVGTFTTTSFDTLARTGTGTNVTENVHWTAIGLKP